MINGVLFTDEKIISSPLGNVKRACTQDSIGFKGFGEVYFSEVNQNKIKGWKLHKNMTVNLIVPVGEVMIAMYDERVNSKTYKNNCHKVIGNSCYQRITIPNNIWFAFKGLAKENLIMNIANIKHCPEESVSKPLDNISFDWEI